MSEERDWFSEFVQEVRSPSTYDAKTNTIITGKPLEGNELKEYKKAFNDSINYARLSPQGKDMGGVLKCMLINEGQTKSNGDTVYLSCANSNYRLLSPLPWTEYKAKRQIRQQQAKIPLQSLWQAVCW